MILLFLFCGISIGEYSIAIQPLGPFDSSMINLMIPEIKSQFDNPKIVVLKPISLPIKAYYKPRSRYRAEILLEFLDSLRNFRYTKIIGLTQTDISTTKGSYEDWGIFGLGAISAGPCIVSTYRLKKNATEKEFNQRFCKVVIHELGHTFGLDHCPAETCIMTDYKGTIKSLDKSEKDFCAKCSQLIKKTIMFLSAGENAADKMNAKSNRLGRNIFRTRDFR
jgi:archaemetzincin